MARVLLLSPRDGLLLVVVFGVGSVKFGRKPFLHGDSPDIGIVRINFVASARSIAEGFCSLVIATFVYIVAVRSVNAGIFPAIRKESE